LSLDAERARALTALAGRLGHAFADLGLLDRALTHTSFANESGREALHNEALEFLGDALLGFAIADVLHRRDPEGDEGAKSRMRAHLVAESPLALRAEALGLPELLLLGRGEEKTGGRRKSALWADAYEAVVAALHLDGGFEAARRFVERDFAAAIAAGPLETIVDHKSPLQELLQSRGQGVPEYAVVSETGPSHRRLFRVECRVAGRAVSVGEGSTKKQAQQEAARRALEVLR